MKITIEEVESLIERMNDAGVTEAVVHIEEWTDRPGYLCIDICE